MKKLISTLLCAAMIFLMAATVFGATALGNFEVKKTDENGNTLGGAEFVLIPDGMTEPAYSAVSDEKGIAHFENVADGYYKLKENIAPEGFIKSDVECTVIVDMGTVLSGYEPDNSGNVVPVPYQTVTFVNKAEPAVNNPLTVYIPITKIVEKIGAYAPRKEIFAFEVYDFRHDGKVSIVSNTVETDGEGEFYGDIVIEVETEDIVLEGFLIREIKGGKARWSYSDSVWEAMPGFDPNGGWTGDFEYTIIENGDPVTYDEAFFVNKYYKAFVPAPQNQRPPEKTEESNPNTGAPVLFYVPVIAAAMGAAAVLGKRK